MRKFVFNTAIVVIGLAVVATRASGGSIASPGQCTSSSATAELTLTMDAQKVLRQHVPKELFGFNLPWRDFQMGLFRDGKVRPQVIDYLKPFQGALYRYPGGTPANSFEWNKAVGPAGSRPKLHYDFDEYDTALFGVDEFFSFLTSVDGRAIYVLNLVGPYKKLPTNVPAPPTIINASDTRASAVTTLSVDDTIASSVAADAIALMRRVAANPAIGCVGGAACKMAYWELGNEMDFPPYLWSGAIYAQRANVVLAAAKSKFPAATFVAQGRTAPWGTPPNAAIANFDKDNAGALANNLSTVALHPYYDGISIPNVHEYLDALIAAWRTASTHTPRVLITEHGRWPPTPLVGSWQDNWVLASGVGGAVSSSDFLLSLFNRSEVDGAMWHALAVWGPWQLFRWDKATDAVFPTPVYWGFRTLREGFLDDLIRIDPSTARPGTYWGGYDVRFVAMKDTAGKAVSVMGVNRGDVPVTIRLQWPTLATGTHLELRSAAGDNERVDNTVANPQQVTMNYQALTTSVAGGGATWCIPAHGVFSVVRR